MTATRRVSFAPEATLHTWNVVELPEDSTTSSNSTNSTRRASALIENTKQSFIDAQSPHSASDASEPPSTPPEQVEGLQVAASPAHQRDLHQNKRKRSSRVTSMDFNDASEFSSSPASIVSEDTGPQSLEEVDQVSDSSDSDDKDLEEDETVTQVDQDDSTTHSTGASSTNSSGRLDAALAQAARQAGTQGIDFDENGDMADDEVTNAFQPWMAGTKRNAESFHAQQTARDQENVNPFLGGGESNRDNREGGENDMGDGTMEMTRAVGGILPPLNDRNTSPKKGKRKSTTENRRRSSIAHSGLLNSESGQDEDETMDLTMAVGGIQDDSDAKQDTHQGLGESDEGLSMEMTSVMGGLTFGIAEQSSDVQHDRNGREDEDITNSGEDMDMTFAAGNILPPITETTEPIEGESMNLTTAVGAILPDQPSRDTKEEAKVLMEKEADMGEFLASPFGDRSLEKPMGVGLNDDRPLPAHVHKATTTSDTGGPSSNKQSFCRSDRKGLGPRQSTTPRSAEKKSTPMKDLGTPSNQTTPQPVRPSTPGKTPPSKNITMRSASPKRLFKVEIAAEEKQAAQSALGSKVSDSRFSNPLFKRNAVTGIRTPSIVLQPGRRRSSGIGADREGLGSPKVTDLLDRRGSLGDNHRTFVPQGGFGANVQFEDPQVMGKEIEDERKEDVRRESGRVRLEQEVDSPDKTESKDITANLKDMIGSLTPQKKKNKLNGRKSLHVGAAKGLLGKRPAELDEETDEEDSTKRLKGREGSPVKKVKLPAPPAKSETTGRLTRSARKNLEEADGNARISTPSKAQSFEMIKTTPKDQSRFKTVESCSPKNVRSFEEKIEEPVVVANPPVEEVQPIHLQDFLNLTNIRFIELTTTKRRHTVVQSAAGDQLSRSKEVDSQEDVEPSSELEKCVVAGICTVPMLELYQHSCRELKNYISEGRSIVKEIEADTYEENPPLFQEYVSASPDVKLIMDNQFKNVKTNARLLSKAMWYEWRMKLLDGLKEGLLKIGGDIEEDHKSLSQQEQLLQSTLPRLVQRHDQLEEQANVAQAQADELAECDQEELKSARETLSAVEQELEEKERLVKQLRIELRDKEDRLETAMTRKQEYAEEIADAEKILQDCRGWKPAELDVLQCECPIRSAYLDRRHD